MTDSSAWTGGESYEDVARAQRWKEWAESDGLYEAIAQIEKQYIEAWASSALKEQDGRERIWQAVQIVRMVKDHIDVVIRNGELAKANIADLEALRTGKKKHFF